MSKRNIGIILGAVSAVLILLIVLCLHSCTKTKNDGADKTQSVLSSSDGTAESSETETTFQSQIPADALDESSDASGTASDGTSTVIDTQQSDVADSKDWTNPYTPEQIAP